MRPQVFHFGNPGLWIDLLTELAGIERAVYSLVLLGALLGSLFACKLFHTLFAIPSL
jgi:hypothetical protein